LILTGEDEQGTGEFHPRLNVVHEAELFQGEKFSNVHGLNNIRFPKAKIEVAFE
jgi:hypothetical protein